ILGLVEAVGVLQPALLFGEHLAQQRPEVLALGEPLAAQLVEPPCGFGLVHRQPAADPAILTWQAIEPIEEAGQRAIREGTNADRLEEARPEPGGKPPDEGAVRNHFVQVEDLFRDWRRIRRSETQPWR